VHLISRARRSGFWTLALALLLVPCWAWAQPVELEMWSPYASPYTRPTVDKLVEMFNENNPDIKLVHVPVSAEMRQRFQVAVAGRNAPDLVITGLTDFYDPAGKPRSEVEREAPFVYLDAVIDPELIAEWRRTYYPDGWSLQDGYFGGPFALPFEANAEVVFYNKDLFSQAGLDPDHPPTLIDQFHEAARKIAQLGQSTGREIFGYLFEAQVPDQVASLFDFAGPLNDHFVPAGYLNKNGDYVFTLAHRKNAEALDALYRIPYEQGWTGQVLGYDYMTARAAFGQGNVGMFRIGAYMMIVYNLQYPDLNYGIADLPKIDPNGGFVEAGSASYWFITKREYGGNPEAAARVVEFLASPQAQALMALEAGKLVPNRAAYDVEGVPDYLLQAKGIMDSRIEAQEAFRQKQRERYPDIALFEAGGLALPLDTVPMAVSGGRIIQQSGEMFQRYISGRMSAREYLTRLEQEWARTLQREGLSVDMSSVGWKE